MNFSPNKVGFILENISPPPMECDTDIVPMRPKFANENCISNVGNMYSWALSVSKETLSGRCCVSMPSPRFFKRQ